MADLEALLPGLVLSGGQVSPARHTGRVETRVQLCQALAQQRQAQVHRLRALCDQSAQEAATSIGRLNLQIVTSVCILLYASAEAPAHLKHIATKNMPCKLKPWKQGGSLHPSMQYSLASQGTGSRQCLHSLQQAPSRLALAGGAGGYLHFDVPLEAVGAREGEGLLPVGLCLHCRAPVACGLRPLRGAHPRRGKGQQDALLLYIQLHAMHSHSHWCKRCEKGCREFRGGSQVSHPGDFPIFYCAKLLCFRQQLYRCEPCSDRASEQKSIIVDHKQQPLTLRAHVSFSDRYMQPQHFHHSPKMSDVDS